MHDSKQPKPYGPTGTKGSNVGVSPYARRISCPAPWAVEEGGYVVPPGRFAQPYRWVCVRKISMELFVACFFLLFCGLLWVHRKHGLAGMYRRDLIASLRADDAFRSAHGPADRAQPSSPNKLFCSRRGRAGHSPARRGTELTRHDGSRRHRVGGRDEADAQQRNRVAAES